MDVIDKERVEQVAANLTRRCHLFGADLFAIYTQATGLSITWRQFDDPSWGHVDQGLGFCRSLEVHGKPVLDFFYIHTRKVVHDERKPVYVAIHELGHWHLGHFKRDRLEYAPFTSLREELAHWFAFVVLALCKDAVPVRGVAMITKPEVARLGKHFLPHLFNNDAQAEAEIDRLRSAHPM